MDNEVAIDKFLRRVSKKSNGVALSLFNKLKDEEKGVVASKVRRGKLLLHVFAKRSSYEIVGKIAEYTTYLEKTDDKLRTPLLVAVEYGNIDAARALLERGAQVDYYRRRTEVFCEDWPLRVAVTKGNIDMVRLLIQFKANLEM
jgi:hypothetical protein